MAMQIDIPPAPEKLLKDQMHLPDRLQQPEVHMQEAQPVVGYVSGCANSYEAFNDYDDEPSSND